MEYFNGKFHGQGYYKFNDKEYYKGSYENGIKQGLGEITYKDGTKINCNFDNGKLNGIGTIERPNSKKQIKVQFINGKLNKSFNNSTKHR